MTPEEKKEYFRVYNKQYRIDKPQYNKVLKRKSFKQQEQLSDINDSAKIASEHRMTMFVGENMESEIL